MHYTIIKLSCNIYFETILHKMKEGQGSISIDNSIYNSNWPNPRIPKAQFTFYVCSDLVCRYGCGPVVVVTVMCIVILLYRRVWVIII